MLRNDAFLEFLGIGSTKVVYGIEASVRDSFSATFSFKNYLLVSQNALLGNSP